MIRWPKLRQFAAAFFVATVAALATVSSSTPARADDLTTCIGGWAKKAMNPQDIALALDFMAKHGDCVAKLADPSGRFAAIVAALSVMKKAGTFNTENDCKGMISSLLGKVVIQVSNTVGSVIGMKVPAYIESQGEDAVINWVNAQADSNPTISAIKADMDCGCAVAAIGVDYLEDLLKTLVEVAEACAGLIGDIAKLAENLGEAIFDGLTQAAEALGEVGQATLDLLEDCLTAAAGQKSVIDCLEEIPDAVKAIGALLGSAAGAVGDFFDALGGVLSWVKPACCATLGSIWGGFCGGCSKPAKPTPPKVDIGCQGVLCEKGLQCGGELHDRCVPCSEAGGIAGYGKADNMCGCAFGFSPQYVATPGGPVLAACKCDPPKKTISLIATAVCACPNQGEKVLYQDGMSYCGCPWGEKLQNGKCQAVVCKPPFSLGADGKTCVQTTPVSIKDAPQGPVQAVPILPCPPNYRWEGGTCVYGGPLTVPPPGPHSAKPKFPGCPPGFLWTGTTCVAIGTAVPGKPGAATVVPSIIPACPPNTKWDGAKCAPVATTRAPVPQTLKVQPVVPQCPPNTKWDGRTCAALPAVQIKPGTIKLAPVLPRCPANTRWDGRQCAPIVPLQPRVPIPGPMPPGVAPQVR